MVQAQLTGAIQGNVAGRFRAGRQRQDVVTDCRRAVSVQIEAGQLRTERKPHRIFLLHRQRHLAQEGAAAEIAEPQRRGILAQHCQGIDRFLTLVKSRAFGGRRQFAVGNRQADIAGAAEQSGQAQIILLITRGIFFEQDIETDHCRAFFTQKMGHVGIIIPSHRPAAEGFHILGGDVDQQKILRQLPFSPELEQCVAPTIGNGFVPGQGQ